MRGLEAGSRACWQGRMAAIAILAMLTAGCSSKPPPAPAAASNEVFGSGLGAPPAGLLEIDDRWASVTLDDQQRAEVRASFRDLVHGPIPPLEKAPYGIRFEDIPRAMINAAPKVEMAILSQAFLPAAVTVVFEDHIGREASASLILRDRGPLASVEYLVPGVDVAPAKSRLLLDLYRRLAEEIEHGHGDLTPNSAAEILRASVRSRHGRIKSGSTEPDRYRYTLLMLDELEAVIEFRREPGPKVISWTATAGFFGKPQVVDALAEAVMTALRAWGQDLEPRSPNLEPPVPAEH